LLAIPGIAEQDIRASLLKGELQHKILARDIVITCSDIDLLQFNEDQKQFLINSGIIDGLEVGSNQVSGLSYIWRIEIPLIGTKNGINKTFFTPDKFINGTFDTGDDFHIQVKHNGRDLYEDFDYYVSESEGTGTGYDTINLISITPNTNSKLFATYVKRV
jgi:hypothetical protein